MKKINKAKLIKNYFGDVIKEYGFEYAGATSGIWSFVRTKDDIEQEVFLQQHRFFSNQVKMVFHTKAYGWRDQEPMDYMEKYKNQEFWEYNSEEEYIEVLKEFVEILKTQGLDVLEKMFIPLDPIYPTPEMEKKLYESYQLLIEEAHTKYQFERSGEEAIEKVCELIYQKKDKEYEEVKDFLVEMAAIFVEVFVNDMGGRLDFLKNKCVLEETGINKKKTLIPLMYIVSTWKMRKGNMGGVINLLLLEYRQFKEKY